MDRTTPRELADRARRRCLLASFNGDPEELACQHAAVSITAAGKLRRRARSAWIYQRHANSPIALGGGVCLRRLTATQRSLPANMRQYPLRLPASSGGEPCSSVDRYHRHANSPIALGGGVC